MHLRRAVVGLVLLTASALVTPLGSGSTASAASHAVAVCLVSNGAPGVERDVLVPPAAADRLIRATLSYRGPCASYGESAPLGNGRLQVFSQSRGRVPEAIGVAMRRGTLNGLPHHPPTAGNWCYDVNGDGTIDQHTECVGGYDHALHFSEAFRSGVDTPYQFMLINWNPTGHIPLGVYDVPHFDTHFYVTSNAERAAIRPGPCALVVNCDDYAVAKMPVDAKYLAPDYTDVDAVESGMGNHLIDLTGPEFNGQPFTHTFIYGVYGGRVTYYEPMVTHAVLRGLTDGTFAERCVAMKLPQAWQRSGWYPTRYCLRYRSNRAELTITLEDFVYRRAG